MPSFLDDAAATVEISAAAKRIAGRIRKTPVINFDGADFGLRGQLTAKLEHLQVSGTFKARGAFNNLLSRDVPSSGVIAASGGNHGAAVAYAANRLGHRAEIFVPTIASPVKIERLRAFGAIVTVVGDEFADTLAASLSRQAETGAMTIHAYDQIETVVGQGTAGLEFEAEAPELDTVLVAVGGGGLIAGVASWYQGRSNVIAVETRGTAALYRAREAGHPVDVAVEGIAADALGARRIGEIAFEVAQRHVQGAVVVSDDAVVAARRALWDSLRTVAEPAAAAPLAALMTGAYQPSPDERVGLLVCGANTSLTSIEGSSAKH